MEEQDFKHYYMYNNTIIKLHVWASHRSFESASAFAIALLSCGMNGETEVTKLEIKSMSSNSGAVSVLVHSF